MMCVHPIITNLPEAEYEKFCMWLREYCGTTIFDLVRLSKGQQADAYLLFIEEMNDKEEIENER